MHEIIFKEKEHEYWVDGVLKPSVSQIIKCVLKNDEPIPEYAKPAMARGTYTHSVIKMALLNRLDESSIDECVKGYYKSFSLWWKANGGPLEFVEKVFYEPAGDFCMTLDVAMGDSEIKDWKTGQIYPTYGPQLGGYSIGYMANTNKIVKKISCVQLFKNGIIAKEHVYDLQKCQEDWNAINRVYRLKKENK